MGVRAMLAGVMLAAVCAAPAAADEKPEPPLRFATYNVCKTSCGTGRFSWTKRAPAVIRNIISSKADVVALQEADNSHEWIEDRLRRHGYAKIQAKSDDCTPLGSACIDDSWLFYKTSRVTPLVTDVPNEPISEPCRPFINDQGTLPLEPTRPELPARPQRSAFPTRMEYTQATDAWRAQTDPLIAAYEAAWDQYETTMAAYERADDAYGCSRFVGWTPMVAAGSGFLSWKTVGKDSLERTVDDRNFTWAVMRDRRTGGTFVPVSMHMPNEKTGWAERYRVSLAHGLLDYLGRTKRDLGVGAAPVVLMGDFNSFRQRQPKGVQCVFGRAGFTDAISARTRVNEEVPPMNLIRPDGNPFPPRPFRQPDPARIDYILFSKGTARRYEVHLRLKPSGAFDNRFRGSDHNLVLADLVLPVVKAGPRWKAE